MSLACCIQKAIVMMIPDVSFVVSYFFKKFNKN